MARGLAAFDGQALQQYRATSGGTGRGISADRLAKEIGTTKAQILAYEQGRQVPEPQRIRALAEALGIHPLLLSGKEFKDMSLADLRRACGFRASEIVQQLAVSPKVYRRFEVEGMTPTRRSSLIYELANTLGLTVQQIERALLQTPEVVARVERIAELVQQFRLRHVANPEPWAAPSATDPLVHGLALLVGRSPTRVARLAAYIFGEERTRVMRIDREVVAAIYHLRPERRHAALVTADSVSQRYQRDMALLPAKIDQFFRYAMSATVWHAVQRLTRHWIPFSRTGIAPEVIRLIPSQLAELRSEPSSSRLEIKLTGYGTSHLLRYKAWYTAFYPSTTAAAGLDARTIDTLRAVQARESSHYAIGETENS